MFELLLSMVLILAVPSGARMGETVGSKVVVRNSIGGQVSEVTSYTTSDRRRVEMRTPSQRRNADGAVEEVERHTVFITRCDLGQSFTLNVEAKEYTAALYPPMRLTPEEMAARGIKAPSPSEATQPTLRVETTTVDTGERKEFFGRMARHVIITTKQTPLEGSHAEAQETVSDGWYIDLDRRLSCDPPRKEESAGHGYISIGVTRPGRDIPREKPEFVDIGPRETGFPVKVTRTSPGTRTWPDGRTEPFSSMFESEVTQLEEGPIDLGLFEIPADFKRVERARRMTEPE